MKQYQWRRSITIGVIASLLLGLAAVGLGIEALHKIDNLNTSESVVNIITPNGGATVSGVVTIDANTIGPPVIVVDFLATGGRYNDAKIASGSLTSVGWASEWPSTSVPNGTYEIAAVGYNAGGQSSRSASITVNVQNS